MTPVTTRSWLAARWQRHGKVLKFLMVGGVNTLLGLALYPAMLFVVPFFHRHYLIALGVAQVFCLCFAFVLYKLTVFRTRAKLLREIATFASFYLVTYAINWVVLPVLVEWVHISPAIAQPAFTLVTTIASYLWHNNVTFRTAGER